MGRSLFPKQQRVRVRWRIEPFADRYRITSFVDLNKRWGTSVDVLETHRIFKIEDNGKSAEQQVYEQCEAAGKDLFDRLDFIYRANHGMLDREGFTVRFHA